MCHWYVDSWFVEVIDPLPLADTNHNFGSYPLDGSYNYGKLLLCLVDTTRILGAIHWISSTIVVVFSCGWWLWLVGVGFLLLGVGG